MYVYMCVYVFVYVYVYVYIVNVMYVNSCCDKSRNGASGRVSSKLQASPTEHASIKPAPRHMLQAKCLVQWAEASPFAPG